MGMKHQGMCLGLGLLLALAPLVILAQENATDKNQANPQTQSMSPEQKPNSTPQTAPKESQTEPHSAPQTGQNAAEAALQPKPEATHVTSPAAVSGGPENTSVTVAPTGSATVPNTSAFAAMEKAKSMAIWPQLYSQTIPPGDIQAGKTKAEVCVACHGVDGNSTVTAWPKIAGQGELYLVKELVEYRKGDKGSRFDPSMFTIVQNLSDQDIADLAAYFASLNMSPGSAKADLVALGEKIYRGGNPTTGVPACAACHDARGEGNEVARFPRLAGQHEDYTLEQLKKFKAKTRSDDPNSIMQDISKRMSEDEMKAVSSYVSGLH